MGSSHTIVIPPPNIEMMDFTGHIFYLSSSLSFSQANLFKVSACVSIKPPSTKS